MTSTGKTTKTLEIIGGSTLLVIGAILVYLNWFKIVPGLETHVEQIITAIIAYGCLIGFPMAIYGAGILINTIFGINIPEVLLEKFFPDVLNEYDEYDDYNEYDEYDEYDDLEEIEGEEDLLNLEELLNSEDFEKIKNSEDFCTYFEMLDDKVICKDSSSEARK